MTLANLASAGAGILVGYAALPHAIARVFRTRTPDTESSDRALLDWARTHRLVFRDTLGRPILDMQLDLIQPFTAGQDVTELMPGLTLEAAENTKTFIVPQPTAPAARCT
ncbi:hypothetical protein GA0115240_10581, partial [Streptomyces sp. DvalAA-14]|uniref:hypothetical protein n=1 Tax=unclassified Streptomyces TaxID=2593676 RepID=UPI00081B5F2A